MLAPTQAPDLPMPPLRLLPAALLVVGLSLPGPAGAQTANGSPLAPAAASLSGTPAPVSRLPPSAGRRRGRADAGLAPGGIRPLPKPTAADRAEQRKLEHDLHICIGC